MPDPDTTAAEPSPDPTSAGADETAHDRPGWARRALTIVGAIVVVVLIAAIAVVLVARRSSDEAGAPATTARTTVTGIVAPLTGLDDPSGESAKRCAITVKVDNTRQGQPQRGLADADVVYEEIVEGNITRLAAVFQSHAPDEVGPVRSVRRTDQSIVWPLRGVFVFSGGAPYALASIDTAPVVQVNEDNAGAAMFRDDSRSAPFNLYANLQRVQTRCKDPAPPPLFTYRDDGAPTAGKDATRAVVGFGEGYAVTWDWNADAGTWSRSLFGTEHLDERGAPLTVSNVVIMVAPYTGGVGVVGAEAALVGSGKLWVLTDGKVVTGTWSRPDKASAARLLDDAGKPIAVTPGRTWVELPDPSKPITITP